MQTLVVIIAVIRLVYGLVNLNNENNFGSISADLAKLAERYQDCFIHLILNEQEVSLAPVDVPFVLANPIHFQKNYKQHVQKLRPIMEAEKFPFPLRSFRCMLTAYVIIESQFYRNKYICKNFGLHLFLQQGKQTITQHKIIVFGSYGYLNEFDNYPGGEYHCQFSLLGTVDLTFYWLMYTESFEGFHEHRPVYIVRSAVYVAEYTAKPAYAVQCKGWEQCLSKLFALRSVAVKKGHNVIWSYAGTAVFRMIDYLKPLETWKYCPLKAGPENHVDCSTEIGAWTLYHFLTLSLNKTLLKAELNSPDRLNPGGKSTPKISWTEEFGEGLFLGYASKFVVPLQAFPLTSTQAKRESLRFITSGGAVGKRKHVRFYSAPFEDTVWVGLLLMVTAFCVLISYATARSNYKIWPPALFESFFWFLGASVQQEASIQINNATTCSSSRRIKAGAVAVATVAIFVLRTTYTGVMNADYVTHTEYQTSLTSLDQIQNFTIFIPTDPRTVSYIERSHEKNKSTFLGILEACTEQKWQSLRAQTACYLATTVAGSMPTKFDGAGCSKALDSVFHPAKPIAASLEECKDKQVHALVNTCNKVQFVLESEVRSYFQTKLRQSETALLLTEESFHYFWGIAQDVIRNDSSIRLAHNYFSPFDTSISPKKQHMVYITSGLEPEYTRMVTDKVNVLLTAGLWDEWVRLNKYKKDISSFQGEPRRQTSDFVPLSVEHDAIYFTTMAFLVGLLGISLVFMTVVLKEAIPKITFVKIIRPRELKSRSLGASCGCSSSCKIHLMYLFSCYFNQLNLCMIVQTVSKRILQYFKRSKSSE